MNDTQQTILGRRTIHTYSTEPLPEGALTRALACALRAPNHKLTNPWRFTRLGPDSRAAVTELGVALKRDKAGDRWNDTREATVHAKLSSPAELVVVSQVLSDDDFRRREDYASVACAIHGASLSLWSEGVGSKWSTGGVTSHPRAYEIAHIDPDVEEIIGFLWMGTAAVTPDPERAPLEDVMREVP